MANSVNWLIQWHKSGYSDPGNAWSSSSSSSSSSSVVAAAATMMMMEDASWMGNLATSMFIKLAEALRKTSLVQREEVWDQCRHAYVAQLGLVHAYECALLANLACMHQLAFLACCSLRFWL
uniref:Uncharacterized protein n=1 Tax=Oryza nivara TaxID=4536 RepID=A0A0E0HNT7_ORYNI